MAALQRLTRRVDILALMAENHRKMPAESLPDKVKMNASAWHMPEAFISTS